MDQAPYTLSAGTELHGKFTYRVERVLGAGGFGITYLASTQVRFGNLSTEAKVAIKELYRRDDCLRDGTTGRVLTADNETARRNMANARKDFLSEARRLADISRDCDGIVKVNEVFEENGTAYYVMEYLEGQTLEEYIRSHGPIIQPEALKLITPVVKAVAFLHMNRLTHLDIKPDNIMLTADMRPVLIDFGLSKHYDHDGNATSTLNTVAYSPGYAPIEQYVGLKTFSPTADVYALGATMYRMITGHRPAEPFHWEEGEPRASLRKVPITAQLESIVLKAMSLTAAERYPTAGVLLQCLEGLFVPEPEEPNHTPSEPTYVCRPKEYVAQKAEAPIHHTPLHTPTAASDAYSAALRNLRKAPVGAAPQIPRGEQRATHVFEAPRQASAARKPTASQQASQKAEYANILYFNKRLLLASAVLMALACLIPIAYPIAIYNILSGGYPELEVGIIFDSVIPGLLALTALTLFAASNQKCLEASKNLLAGAALYFVGLLFMSTLGPIALHGLVICTYSPVFEIPGIVLFTIGLIRFYSKIGRLWEIVNSIISLTGALALVSLLLSLPALAQEMGIFFFIRLILLLLFAICWCRALYLIAKEDIRHYTVLKKIDNRMIIVGSAILCLLSLYITLARFF